MLLAFSSSLLFVPDVGLQQKRKSAICATASVITEYDLITNSIVSRLPLDLVSEDGEAYEYMEFFLSSTPTGCFLAATTTVG